ncbi:MAG: hypothetical protein IJH86_06125, partial [Clostridia bacterium]|nr:hypothetical protein [Clostridia bacterium]
MSFSLSPSQSRILLAELNHPGTTAYNLYFRMRFDPADEALLCRAIPEVISGNFGLRVRAGGDTGYEQYYSDQPATYEVMDTDAPEETVAALKRTPIAPLFDAPLYRLYVLRAAGAVWFFGAFHHLIADGTTFNAVLPARLYDCVAALRQGREWAAPKASYDEYLRRVTAYLASPESAADRDYWLQHLGGFRGAGYQAGALTKGSLSCDIPEALTARWLPFQSENRVSSFVLALGAVFAYWQGLRERLGSRHDDMVWEISVNGRYFGDDIAREPGMYVETLPLRL